MIQYRGGFCDRNKKIVIEPGYDDVRRFSEGFAAVKLKGKWGFIDKAGREVVPLKYDEAWQFNEGLAAVSLKPEVGFHKPQRSRGVQAYSYLKGITRLPLFAYGTLTFH